MRLHLGELTRSTVRRLFAVFGQMGRSTYGSGRPRTIRGRRDIRSWLSIAVPRRTAVQRSCRRHANNAEYDSLATGLGVS